MPPRERPPGSPAAPDSGVPSLWESWFRSATPHQQQELLNLADRQGFLWSHQLPAPANGVHPRLPEPRTKARIAFQQLLHETTGAVEFSPASVKFLDGELDPWQKQAVAKALATPDLCLIQGQAGTGKSRVAAELLSQLAAQGARTLFLAQHASAIDVVLERLSTRDGLFPIRFLEKTESVLPTIQPMVYPERLRVFRSQTLNGAKCGLDLAEARWQERLQQADAWPKLKASVERKLELDRLQAELDAEQSRPIELAEPSLVLALERGRSDLQSTLNELRLEEEDDQGLSKLLQEDIAVRESERNRLDEFLKAQAEGRWWTVGYWKAKFQPQRAKQRDRVASQLEKIQRDYAEIEKRREARKKAEADATQTWERLEQTYREAAEERRTHRIQLAREELRSQLEACEAQRLAALPIADDADCTHLEEVEAAWALEKQRDWNDLQFARQWAEFVQIEGEQLVGRLAEFSNLIAGPFAALDQNADFLEPGQQFDVLVIEEAHLFTEAELLDLTRRAERCVLIGAFPLGPSKRVQDDVFPRLWKRFHDDLPTPHYAWRCDDGRWTVQLQSLTPEIERKLEREPLADNPGVDLYFHTQSKGQTKLVQVRFPESFPLKQCKEWIRHELDEWALCGASSQPWLEEAEDCIQIRFSTAAADSMHEIEPGLREAVAGAQTLGLHFDRRHWTRERCDAWALQYLHWRDAGRTAHLPHCYRMPATMLACVRDLFLMNGHAVAAGADAPPSVTFVPVPALGTNGKRLPRDGAGFEVDLSGTRFADKMPEECRFWLPRHGFANYFEAQSVVQTLERLARDHALPADTGVLAFFPGQVELIRRLVHQSSTLAGLPAIEVGLPNQFRDRERCLILLSLTRSSNTHRTGEFVQEQAEAVLALTRSRGRLILVGDAGTLLRWSQSETNGQVWVRQLARYLQGQGTHQGAFQLCEGA